MYSLNKFSFIVVFVGHTIAGTASAEGAPCDAEAPIEHAEYMSCLVDHGLLVEAMAYLKQNRATLGSTNERLQDTREYGIDPDISAFLFRADKNDSTASHREIDLAFARSPTWLKLKHAVAISEQWLRLGERAYVYGIADNLRQLAEQDSGSRRAELKTLSTYLTGRADENRGDIERALRFYRLAAAGNTALTDIHADARLRIIAIEWRHGRLRTDETVNQLERALWLFPAGAIGARTRLALSRAYIYDDQHGNAVRQIHLLLSHPELSETAREQVLALARSLLTQLATRSEEVDLATVIYAWETLRPHLIGSNNPYLDMTAADYFASVGLHSVSQEVINLVSVERAQKLSGEDVMRLSHTANRVGLTERASQYLLSVENQAGDLDTDIQLTAASVLGQESWSDLSARALSHEAQLVLANRAYHAGDWQTAATLYNQFDKLPPSEQKKRDLTNYLATGERTTTSSDGFTRATLLADHEVTPKSANEYRSTLHHAANLIEWQSLKTRQSHSVSLSIDSASN